MRVLLLVVAGFLGVSGAVAQTATLTGTVTDRDGVPLPGANVLVQSDTARYGGPANSEGRYSISGLPPGRYTIEARFVGYESTSKSATLSAGQTRTMSFTLHPSTQRVQEVVVTAQDRRQRLQDVPISATAFTAADLTETRVTAVEDYAAMTPNLTSTSSGRRSASDITIRGVSNLGGQNNAFGVYVDGLNVTPSSSDIAINPKLLDVRRIEVLRGPQGTHFGRNAIAGAVSIITEKPDDEWSASVRGRGERFRTVMGSGSVNAPVTDDLFVRANGFYERAGGFIDDIGPAENTNSRDEWGGRLAVRYEPVEALTIDVSGSRSEFDQGYPTTVPSDAINPALESILESLGNPGGIREGQGTFPQNETRISTDASFRSELTTTTATSRVAYAFDTFEVRALTGWIEGSSATVGEADNTAQDIITRDEEETLRSFSQEVRVQSTGTDPSATWLAGAHYANDETRFIVDSFFGDDFPLAAFLPASPPFPFGRNRTRRVTESYALFGEVGTSLWNDRLDLLAGLRYTHDDVRSENDNRRFSIVTNTSDPDFPGFFTERDTTGSISFDDVSPRLAVTAHVTESTTLYATVSRGYKAGGFNESQTQGDATFREEALWNYEVGLKGDLLNRRLRVEASVFYMDWSDLQVNSVDLSTGTPVFQTQNAAEASSRGAEVQMRAVPLSGLEVGGSAGSLDATFDRFPRANVEGEQRDLSGGPLPRAPDWTAHAFSRYEHVLTEGMRGFVRGEVTYSDGFYEDIAARNPFFVPAHTTWGFSAGITTSRFRISAYVENAFDTDSVAGIRETSLSLSGLQVAPRPRIFGVELQAALL
jgi:iron complex outermembrane receptor protein